MGFPFRCPGHVIYVWFDALASYLTGIGYGEDDSNFNKYWPADVHLVGKDIAFSYHNRPTMLLAMGLPCRNKFWPWMAVVGRGKCPSQGNVVDPMILVERYGVDAIRYYSRN